MKTYLLVSEIIISIGIWGCMQIPEGNNKIDYEALTYIKSEKPVSPEPLAIDTFYIYAEDENQMTSLIGEFFLQEDTLCFADIGLTSVFCYDLNGKYIKSHLSQGRGPQELIQLDIVAPCKEGYHIMGGWNFYYVDRQWNKIQERYINWNSDKSVKYLYNHPDPNETGIYEVEYAGPNLRTLGKDYLVIPIVTEHVKYNSYGGAYTSHFYENTYTIGILTQDSAKLVKMMCNRSPIYSQYSYVPNFKNVIFDTYQDTLFFSFEIDPHIYQMDFSTSQTIGFGKAGQQMNTDYPETKSLEDADKHFGEDINKCGYYYHLKYVPETTLLFRSFQHGTPLTYDGLQVYKNQLLVAEYHVPKGFRVIGYVPPYYYAEGKPDIDKEAMVFYRFKLPF